MCVFSEKVINNLKNASWIRAMFEEGERLAKIYGRENVYDFSLGNPFSEPPEEVIESLKNYVTGNYKGIHKYMNNAGYPEVREKIAQSLRSDSQIGLTQDNIIMTVGAAGGLNVVLKALLNPGEEIIIFAPYFVEYIFYTDNHGGKPVIVPPDPRTLEPDLDALEKAVSPKTKAIVINTPNNPTGIVYSKEKLEQIKEILQKKENEYSTIIYIISDQPYDQIVYDGMKIPNILSIFENSIIVNSFSKSLGLAGERIGYIAASSRIKDADVLNNALSFCNRTLGFVNAPGLFQKVIGDSLDVKTDTADYQKKRDYLYEHLTALGFECVKPQGAFYLFPKALIEDDVEFVKRAVKYNLLLVPGSGFGCPGHIRISYCVSMDTIVNSIPAFEKLVQEFRS
jgi:aspartate aminotransferase